MMKQLIAILILLNSLLWAITLTDTEGLTTTYDYEYLASLPRAEVETIREKDGETRLDSWSGFRFDEWLRNGLGKPFEVIRFESGDRYMVSFSKVEFEAQECWLVFSQNGKTFADNSMRAIFPALRDQKWVRGLERVVLEDFDPLSMPKRFELLERRLDQENLLENPAPFVNTRGYYFADLLPLSARQDTLDTVFYSSDGMKLALEFPKHLEGAIIEFSDDGFNLKSPQIPGGMWLKDIIYIQIGDTALIHSGNLDALIALNRIMDWKLNPDVKFLINKPAGGSRELKEPLKLSLNELLAKPEFLADVDSFELAH